MLLHGRAANFLNTPRTRIPARRLPLTVAQGQKSGHFPIFLNLELLFC